METFHELGALKQWKYSPANTAMLKKESTGHKLPCRQPSIVT
jgi:hypothetical protein